MLRVLRRVPDSNSAPDSFTPANQKFDLFLFILMPLSFGAGSALGAGAAKAPDKVTALRIREEKLRNHFRPL